MSAWDDLLDRIDRIAHERSVVDEGVEAELTTLLVGAMRDGTADRELDPGDAGRWLATLLRSHADVSAQGEELPEGALSTLRVIVTRWLHPGRLDQAPPTFGA